MRACLFTNNDIHHQKSLHIVNPNVTQSVQRSNSPVVVV